MRGFTSDLPVQVLSTTTLRPHRARIQLRPRRPLPASPPRRSRALPDNVAGIRLTMPPEPTRSTRNVYMAQIDKRGRLDDEPFDFRATKSGVVFISWHGKTVTTLKGKHAETFLARIVGLDASAAQLLMAKATGHFKHGTERPSGPCRG